MSRQQPNGEELHWRLTFPQLEMGGAVPFVIDWGGTASPTTTAPSGVELIELHVLHPDPSAIRNAHDALGFVMDVENAGTCSLHASIRGPGGMLEL